MIDWEYQLALAQTNLMLMGSKPVHPMADWVRGIDKVVGDYIAQNPPLESGILYIYFNGQRDTESSV
jgi:hypothetical protein